MHLITELQYSQVKVDRKIDKSTITETLTHFLVIDRLTRPKNH